MLTLRRLPQWQLGRRVTMTGFSNRTLRAQHDQHKPTVQSATASSPDPIQVLNARAQFSDAATPRPVSILQRVLRSIVYAGLFGLTGFAISWGFKTWMYLRMGQKIGQPAIRQANKEWFAAHMDGSHLVQSLRREGWIEEDPMKQEQLLDRSVRKKLNMKQGHNMVNERLAQNGYIGTKHFRHPTEGMTMLVFMADYACESWPNTLHGGIATTVIQEALDTHLKHFPEYAPIRDRNTTMNYRLPLNPGKMYSVLVRTEGIDYPDPTFGLTPKSLMGVAVELLVNEIDRAPRYVERYNEATKMNERIIDIHNVRPEIKAYVRGGSVLFLASKQYREMIEQNPTIIPTLRAKRDAWLKAYSSKSQPPK